MALQYGDRIQETFTTTGTGTISLGGAVIGYQAFSAVCSNSDTAYYAATDGTNWEVGLGTYTTSGNTLARTTILASSNAGSAVSWGAGTKNIWLDYPANKASGGTLVAVTPFTSGGTWTPNAKTNMAIILGVAGGGGGGGAGTGSPGAGGTGGTTSVGSLLSLAGGVGGTIGSGSAIGTGGAGGAATTATFKIPGSGGGTLFSSVGGWSTQGAPGFFGGGNSPTTGSGAGASAAANSGAGGNGGCGVSAVTNGGGGGGGGGAGITFATGITGTYTVTIGAGGTAGTTGGSNAGGTGGSGSVLIFEFA
jgi:hypothetical protein